MNASKDTPLSSPKPISHQKMMSVNWGSIDQFCKALHKLYIWGILTQHQRDSLIHRYKEEFSGKVPVKEVRQPQNTLGKPHKPSKQYIIDEEESLKFNEEPPEIINSDDEIYEVPRIKDLLGKKEIDGNH
jgi:hypothetical protein